MAENITATRVSPFPEGIRTSRQFELVRLTGHTATVASGTVTFDDNPTDGETLTLNGYVITFKTGVGNPLTDVEIGADAAETLANLMALLDATVDPLLTIADFSSDEVSVLTISSSEAGTDGNDFTLATDGADIILSSATLTGGTDTTVVGDTSFVYPSGLQRPLFCVGSAVISSISGSGVVFKSLVALGSDVMVVKLYSA